MTRAGVPQSHPRTAHYMPYRTGDSLAAIDRAVREGYDYIDQNAHVTSDDVIVVTHWDSPTVDGFTWLWTGDYRGGAEVRVPDPRRGVPIQKRPWLEVSRLRTKRTGAGYRIYTAKHHVRYCAGRIVLCLEPKQDKAFEERRVWRDLRKYVDQLPGGAKRNRVIVMTLRNLGNWSRRLRAAHPYFPTALLARGAKPSAASWAIARLWTDAVWGGWSK